MSETEKEKAARITGAGVGLRACICGAMATTREGYARHVLDCAVAELESRKVSREELKSLRADLATVAQHAIKAVRYGGMTYLTMDQAEVDAINRIASEGAVDPAFAEGIRKAAREAAANTGYTPWRGPTEFGDRKHSSEEGQP